MAPAVLMPTVAELANEAAPLGVVVAAGSAGLGRQVSRIVRLSPDRLDGSLQTGDLVLVSLAEWQSDTPGAASKLIGEISAHPVAALVVAGEHCAAAVQNDGQRTTPILGLRHGVELEQIHGRLPRWLIECQLAEERVARELNEEFLDFVRAGADTAEVVAHLARLTRKPALLHDSKGKIEDLHQPTSESLPERELRAAISARSSSTSRDGSHPHGVRQLRGVSADELPSLGLTRLTAGLPCDNPTGRYLSLLGRPAAITQRDRAALSAAALALAHGTVDQDREVLFDERQHALPNLPRFAVAMHLPTQMDADGLQRRLRELVGARQAAVHVTDGCLVGVLAAGSPPLQDWERHDLVRAWHTQLSTEFGPISLGYSAIHTGPAGLRQAVLHARQALIAGTRALGPGHACAHGDVSLRSFLSRTGHGSGLGESRLAELHALQETLLGSLIAHDRVEQVKLLPTLEIYLESACVTKHTAERLHIHRNSVVYRLRRIESVAQVDLSDADTRLLLQLALRATRVLNTPGTVGEHTSPPAATPTSNAEAELLPLQR
jgi:PucR family transcriptional regulator, purine catabolism regulatory protein